MSVVQSLFEVTKELVEILQSSTDKENRDVKIDKITELLESRQELINNIKPPYTDEEKLLGKEIVVFNKTIDQKLKTLKFEIQTDMNQLIKTKTSSNKYANPYASVNNDGMFFDKRK